MSTDDFPVFTDTPPNKIRIRIHLGKGHVCTYTVSRVVNKWCAGAKGLGLQLRRGAERTLRRGAAERGAAWWRSRDGERWGTRRGTAAAAVAW